MFFPIGDVNLRRGVKPFLTYVFIALNVVIFMKQVALGHQAQTALIFQWGSIPAEIMSGRGWLTLVTGIFLHGGWMHLIGNMLFLWVFGDNIEATLGYGKFLLFYIGGGVTASLLHCILNASSTIPCVGASGAIAACLGAYILMFPRSQVRVFFLLILTSFKVPALLFLGFWILQQFVAGVGSLGAATSDTDGVAYWAHIGGFLFGMLTGLYFRAEAQRLQHNG